MAERFTPIEAAKRYRPIETAPRNGKPLILAWAPNGFPADHVAGTLGWDGHGWLAADGTYWTEPTHWKYS